jgi:hypothetical protein
MNNGTILADGTLQNLLQGLLQGEIIRFEASARPFTGLLENIEGFNELTWINDQAKGQIIVKNSIRAIPQLIDVMQKEGLELLELETRKRHWMIYL